MDDQSKAHPDQKLPQKGPTQQLQTHNMATGDVENTNVSN